MIGTITRRAALSLALAASAGAANAQTVITREITNEPVETVIEQGPAGTVVTKRPLAATAPRAPVGWPAETVVRESIDEVVLPRETVGITSTTVVPAAETVTTRRVTAQRPRAAPPPRQVRSRTVTQPRPATAPARQATVRRAAPPAPIVRTEPAEPVLTVGQRNRIYRAVLQDRRVPRTIVTDRYGDPTVPVVREDVVSERYIQSEAPIVSERVVTVPPPRETFGFAPRVVDRVVTAPAADEFTIGARLPRTVPVYAIPASVATPALRPYRYAIIDDRVFLVDPVSDVIVAEISE